MNTKVYPRTNDFQTIYLNTVIKNPAIIVGDYTIYSFEKMCCNECYSFEKMCRMLVYSLEKV